MFNENTNTFISLDHLAARLGLPKTYLKQLAEQRSVPYLLVSGRMKFNPMQVQDALDRIASEGGDTEDHNEH
jgi:hypothetical protein